MDTKLIENKWGQRLSRRGFLKFSAAACAVAATPPMLVGCESKTVHYPSNDCLAKFRGVSTVSGIKVFETASFGPINVRNRVIRSATSHLMMDEFGRPTSKMLDLYSELGQGGVGTIITGMEDGGLMVDNTIFRDADMDAYRKVPGDPSIRRRCHSTNFSQGKPDKGCQR